MKTSMRFLMYVLMASMLVVSCSKDEDDSGMARLVISLTDAPGNFEEVNIDIIGVQVIINDSLIDLYAKIGVFNLLELVNGKDTILVNQPVPAGILSQVRLILGDNSTVKVDGILHNLTTPSAQQSGLKFNVHREFIPAFSYAYTIDFDAARSVVATGSGKYNLKPVIRVFAEPASGAIQGNVQPPEAKSLIYAISSDDDSTSTYADTLTGDFFFNGMLQDVYSIWVLPDSLYADTTIEAIQVNTGMITVMDTVELRAVP